MQVFFIIWTISFHSLYHVIPLIIKLRGFMRLDGFISIYQKLTSLHQIYINSILELDSSHGIPFNGVLLGVRYFKYKVEEFDWKQESNDQQRGSLNPNRPSSASEPGFSLEKIFSRWQVEKTTTVVIIAKRPNPITWSAHYYHAMFLKSLSVSRPMCVNKKQIFSPT